MLEAITLKYFDHKTAILLQYFVTHIQRQLDQQLRIRPRNQHPRRDREVDQMYNSLFRVFLTHMLEDPRNITAAMHLHFIAKNIERVGDHATAVAEQVIYLVTGSLPEAQQQALLSQIPLGHLGKPADVAYAVSFLASPRAGYLTGQELHVNGGMFMA